MTQATRTSPLAQKARTTPMLTAEQERELFAAYRASRDARARNKIAMAHLPLVIGEAARFGRYNIPADELITEGNIAVMQAMESFDPTRGVRFCAYAKHWVHSAIMAYLIKNRSVVSIAGTKANKRLFFQLERAKAALMAAHNGRLPENANTLIATALGVTEASVRDMSVRLGGDQSCDCTVSAEDDTALIETMESGEDGPETILLKQEALAVAVSMLDLLTERERHIVMTRIYTDTDTVPELSDLAKIYGVTPQRIHQIEKQALAKLREAILARTECPA
jgi:RNA polymerase sigma-32 factor